MKPDIVFFGENLPEFFHRAMKQDKDEVDLLIVIGSSLKVRPVALIPSTFSYNYFFSSHLYRWEGFGPGSYKTTNNNFFFFFLSSPPRLHSSWRASGSDQQGAAASFKLRRWAPGGLWRHYQRALPPAGRRLWTALLQQSHTPADHGEASAVSRTVAAGGRRLACLRRRASGGAAVGRFGQQAPGGGRQRKCHRNGQL